MEFRGWPVHVERTPGSGVDGAPVAPLVLLHGFGSGSFTWRRALACGLGDGRATVAFDRFGFGRTSRPPVGSWTDENPYSLEGALSLTSAVLGDDTGPVVLVGHSAGALVATAWAARHHERVEALVLVAPAVVDAGPPPPVALAFRVPGARRWGPVLLRAGRPFAARAVATAWSDGAALRSSGVAADYEASTAVEGWAEGLVELTMATRPADTASMLRTVRDAGVRTLVVAGAADRLVKEAAWRQVASLAGASVEVIAGTGHVPHEERPDEFVAVVRRFLGSSSN